MCETGQHAKDEFATLGKPPDELRILRQAWHIR